MNPRDFRALAQKLAGGASPAEYRTAISRAYYGAFHVGAEKLRDLGFKVSKGAAAHGEVIHCLANSANAEIITSARQLSELHTRRIHADYQLDRVDVENSAAAMKNANEAQLVIDVFDRVLTSPQRTQVQAAITAWRKSNGYP